MNTKHKNPSKTLGPQSALLVTTLHERSRPIFTLADAEDITGLEATSTRTLVHKLVGRGVATRLRPGVLLAPWPSLPATKKPSETTNETHIALISLHALMRHQNQRNR